SMAPELSHHTRPSVSRSRTMNLSLGLRPVKTPVVTESAPSAVNSPSPPAMACATSTDATSLCETDPARALIDALRVSWSNSAMTPSPWGDGKRPPLVARVMANWSYNHPEIGRKTEVAAGLGRVRASHIAWRRHI